MMIKTNRWDDDDDDDEVAPMRCMLADNGQMENRRSNNGQAGRQAIGSCTSPFGICIRFVGRMFFSSLQARELPHPPPLWMCDAWCTFCTRQFYALNFMCINFWSRDSRTGQSTLAFSQAYYRCYIDAIAICFSYATRDILLRDRLNICWDLNWPSGSLSRVASRNYFKFFALVNEIYTTYNWTMDDIA